VNIQLTDIDHVGIAVEDLEATVATYPGLHHLAYRVRDLAAALEHVRAEGGRLVDETPRRPGSRNTLIAFVHPRAMGGVLVEFVQEG